MSTWQLWIEAAAWTALKASVVLCVVALGAIVLGMVLAGGPLLLWPEDDPK